MIVISGVGTITRALEAGQAGAFYFIEKSNLDPAGIVSILDRATDLQVERAQHELLKEKVRDQYAFSNVIGKSKKMRELFELIEAVAESDANILIQGENGVGKELIANAIHVRSGRNKGPFIKINCAALPKELIESELFGYKKGAFTGATTDKVGLLELAAGGSLCSTRSARCRCCCRPSCCACCRSASTARSAAIVSSRSTSG
jgi:DNA-binding NtrC family response regulator